jgi:beta-lactamase regulating signal transducer with metallopeptidase domain
VIALPLLIKVTVALVFGLVAAAAAPRARASLRHLFLACTFGALTGLPIAAALAPSIAIEVPVEREEAYSPSPLADAVISSVIADVQVREGVAHALFVPYADLIVASVWAAGTAAFLSPLLMALVRVRRIRRTAVPWARGRRFLHGRRADVLLHEEVAAPMTCGLLRPAIVLPMDAPSWTDDQITRAFAHELEHVHRGDWWMQVASRVVCALYWFHPLVWVAWRRLALEAERACDDAVLRESDSVGYAEQLVSLARRLSPRAPQPLLSMAGRSDLSARVRALLDPGQARGRIGLGVAMPAFAMAALFVAIVAPLNAIATHEVMPLPRSIDLALFSAAEHGRLARVRDLIADGAEVNARIFGDGSPLIAAARNGDVEISEVLLDAGADPNLAVPGDGNPLIMAAISGSIPVIDLLLARGAEVDAAVPEDETPLINASARGHLAVVQRLVDAGADVNLGAWAGRAAERPNDEFRTPLNMAERGGHDAVARFLRSQGAAR